MFSVDSGCVNISLRVQQESMYFLKGSIEQNRGLSTSVALEHAPVGVTARVNVSVAVGGQADEMSLLAFKEDLTLTGGADAVDIPLFAGGNHEVTGIVHG